MEKNCNNCNKRHDCEIKESCKNIGNDYCRFYEGNGEAAKDMSKFNSFEDAVRPLMKWVAENYDPHVKIILSYDKAELIRDEITVITDDFIQD